MMAKRPYLNSLFVVCIRRLTHGPIAFAGQDVRHDKGRTLRVARDARAGCGVSGGNENLLGQPSDHPLIFSCLVLVSQSLIGKTAIRIIGGVVRIQLNGP